MWLYQWQFLYIFSCGSVFLSIGRISLKCHIFQLDTVVFYLPPWSLVNNNVNNFFKLLPLVQRHIFYWESCCIYFYLLLGSYFNLQSIVSFRHTISNSIEGFINNIYLLIFSTSVPHNDLNCAQKSSRRIL